MVPGWASFLADQGEWVTEIDRPKRTGRTQAGADHGRHREGRQPQMPC